MSQRVVCHWYLALHGITFAMDHRIGTHDAVRRRICFHNFELDRSHCAAYGERLAFAQWSVCLGKVGLQEHFGNVS